MLRKRLLVKNITLQLFNNLNLLHLSFNTELTLNLTHLTNLFKSSKTSKFLISADTISNGLRLKYNKNFKKVNLKYSFINYSLSFDLFTILRYLSFKNSKELRLHFLISDRSIFRDLTFFDNDEFNKITSINFINNSFVIKGVFIELIDLLKKEGLINQYNLGDWPVTMKTELKLNDLIYLVFFNISKI